MPYQIALGQDYEQDRRDLDLRLRARSREKNRQYFLDEAERIRLQLLKVDSMQPYRLGAYYRLLDSYAGTVNLLASVGLDLVKDAWQRVQQEIKAVESKAQMLYEACQKSGWSGPLESQYESQVRRWVRLTEQEYVLRQAVVNEVKYQARSDVGPS